MNLTVSRALKVTAVGHTLVGLILFAEPLQATVREGIVGAIVPHFDRVAAFWFLLFSPALYMLAQVIDRAVASRTPEVVRVVSWYLLVLGIIGAVMIPLSGFWLLMAIGLLGIRTAGQMTVLPTVAHTP